MTALAQTPALMPWAVLRGALEGFRKVVARDLGFKSATFVDRWCNEPTDIDGDGCTNPLQRLTAIVASLQSHGEYLRAQMIVRAFAQSVGYVAIPALDGAATVTLAAIGQQLALTGRFTQVAADALADNVMSYEELRQTYAAGVEDLEHQQLIVESLRQQLQQYEAAQVIARMKPDAGEGTRKFLELTR
jgi:hypothetical protein